MIQTKLEHVKKVYNHVKSNRNKSEYSKRRCDYAEYYKKCKVKNIVYMKHLQQEECFVVHMRYLKNL